MKKKDVDLLMDLMGKMIYLYDCVRSRNIEDEEEVKKEIDKIYKKLVS